MGPSGQASRRLIVVDLARPRCARGTECFLPRAALGEHAGTRRWPRTSRASRGHAAVNDTNPPAPTTTTTSTLPPPGPGFVAGRVTAVGDSVMLDYQDPLETDLPGIDVDAAVSRQWTNGEQVLQDLKASGQLGAEVIVGLGTNGPITDSDFDTMMQILSGASRVVFVNTHVDRPWQDPNNMVLANGATRYPQRGDRRLGHPGCAESQLVWFGRHALAYQRAGRGRAGGARDLEAHHRLILGISRLRGPRGRGVASILLRRGRYASGL